MRPVVFLPGVLRLPDQLANVADLGPVLPFPGQGLPVLPVMDLAGLTRTVQPHVPADALVVGESLGGLIALGLPNPAIAIDPPLSMAKQQATRESLMRTVRASNKPALTDLADRVFGWTTDGLIERRDYYGLLRRTAPTLVIAATVRGGSAPTCLDDADYAEIRAAGCRLERVEGPHNLIEANPEAVRRLILEVRDSVEVVFEPDIAG